MVAVVAADVVGCVQAVLCDTIVRSGALTLFRCLLPVSERMSERMRL